MGMKNKQGLCVLSRENRNKIQKKKENCYGTAEIIK